MRCLLCEAQFNCYRLSWRTRKSLYATGEVAHERLVMSLIQTVPWWVHGHMIVCQLLISRAELAPLPPQKSAVLRWTAEAARRLVREQGRKVNRVYWEAECVWAKVKMLEKQFDVALNIYREILTGGSRFLEQTEYYCALEDAAACALILGAEEDSKCFIEQIPPRFRSASVREVVS